MALDAVRELLPNHGLVSSYRAFQPPGLVWAAAPFVALAHGRPEIAMIGFGVLNAASITLLVITVARRWGFPMAITAAAFFVVGPDVVMSPMIWHPSLYTAATCLVLTAGIRIRDGSAWWALPLALVPGLYALIHYSGLVLYGPALTLLVLSRRPPRLLVAPVLVAAGVTLLAWVPFLRFEIDRDWVDIRMILNASDQTPGVLHKITGRGRGGIEAVLHLGQGWHGVVLLTPLLVGLPILAVLLAAWRRRFDEAVVLPAAVVLSGLAVQVLTNMGSRFDVLLLWLPALVLMSAWVVTQVPWRAAVPIGVALVIALGATSVVRAIGDTPPDQTLSAVSAKADSRPNLTYQDLFTLNGVYLPCDPPYTWGTETWYLEEADDSGAGVSAAPRAGAFGTGRPRAGGVRQRLDVRESSPGVTNHGLMSYRRLLPMHLRMTR